MSSRHQSYRSTSDSDEHFVRLAEWLAMESKAEIQRMEQRRKTRDSAKAEQSGETLLDLVIDDEQPGLGGRKLVTLVKRNRELALPWNRLRVGAPVVVSVYPEDSGESWTGVVSKSRMKFIQIALSQSLEGNGFRVDLTADEITRRRQLAAIQVAQQSKGRVGRTRKVCTGETTPDFDAEVSWSPVGVLNESQLAAVEHCLKAQDVAIIHGPPGTGKTTTVIELIVQAVARGEKVLACAPSNTAVDNLLDRLVAAKQRVVRLGHPARVGEQLRAHTLDGQVEESDEMAIIRAMYREAEEIYRKLDRYTRARPNREAQSEMRREARRLQSDARLLERRAVANILDRANVVCATATFNEDLLGDRWYDLCVIDEACQSTEPGCWVPLIRCDKLVLAGDHQQLPPTVLSQEAARDGFSTSLLERLVDIYGDKITRLLSVQYRMNRKIMQFSSERFYDGALECDATVENHLLADLESVETNGLTESALQFIDTAGASWDEEVEPDGESKRNPKEADFVLKKVQQLVESGVDVSTIAIIAPYAAQVRLLRQQSEYSSLEIDTVDGFQGREKECILITLVRSNATGEIGFLSDMRRMNVAMTRAKRKLIVVGDSATLGSYPFYREMIDYFVSHDAYHSVWEEIEYE